MQPQYGAYPQQVQGHQGLPIRVSWEAAITTHFVLFTTVFLAFMYVFHDGNPVDDGTGATPNVWHFQWHPVLMVTGFVLFMGEAIISFRILPFDHDTQKLIHFSFHTVAIVCVATGFAFMYQFHTDKTYAHFYNIHSTIGIFALVLYAVQYIFGFLAFLEPKLPDAQRAAAMPWHKYLGMVIFFSVWGAILTGIMDRQRIFLTNDNEWDATNRLACSLGMMVITSGAVIIYHLHPVSQGKPNNDMETRLLP